MKKTKRHEKEHRLLESGEFSVLPGGSPVDRENRVIRGVKIVGLHSINTGRIIGADSDETYSYSVDALRNAIPLYEGVAVNVDHPAFWYDEDGERHTYNDQRRTCDRFGRLKNVRVIEDSGLFGDLEYLSAHQLAAQVCEAAERMPEVLALSHHAFANTGRDKSGKLVITRINRVESVDLTAERPGTTVSLFESRGEYMLPEEMKKDEEKEMVEMDAPGELSADDQVVEAIVALVRAALKEKDADKAKKAIDALKKLQGVDEPAAPPAEEDSGESEAAESAANQAENGKLVAEVAQLKAALAQRDARDKARDLLESAGIVKPSAAQIKAVAALKEEKDQRELIESFGSGTELGSRPKSAPPANGAETITVPENGKDFARSIR